MAVSFIGGGNRSTRRKAPTFCKSLTNFYHITLYQVHIAWAGCELTTLVVIRTDCTVSFNSNYVISFPGLNEIVLRMYNHQCANSCWRECTCFTISSKTTIYIYLFNKKIIVDELYCLHVVTVENWLLFTTFVNRYLFSTDKNGGTYGSETRKLQQRCERSRLKKKP